MARGIMQLLLTGVMVLLSAGGAMAEGKLPEPRQGNVYVVAHRGVHEGIPENTLAAYRKAIELGCDFVEVDVRTTKDGELVSVHNASVEAYAPGQAGRVKEMTLAELQALDIGSRVGPEWKEERIPRMEDVFALCKGKIGIYLDVKDADTEKLLAMVRAHGMEESCVWFASPAQLTYVEQHCEDCHPMPDPGPEKNLGRVLERFRPRVVASDYSRCSVDFVKACHAAGAIVIADDDGKESWQPMLDWGMDGIQTDDPEGLIRVLRGR